MNELVAGGAGNRAAAWLAALVFIKGENKMPTIVISAVIAGSVSSAAAGFTVAAFAKTFAVSLVLGAASKALPKAPE